MHALEPRARNILSETDYCYSIRDRKKKTAKVYAYHEGTAKKTPNEWIPKKTTTVNYRIATSCR